MNIYEYTATDWMLFFYIYCFLGWCWESIYISVCEKKWVNRGFMHGPYIPIYGTGAIFILISTLPIWEYPAAVYFAGLISATLLEFMTGVIMEALFNVRYWDYSKKKFNYKGHICLESSVAWGFMSLFMVYVIHEPISGFVLSIPMQLRIPLSIVITCVFCADFGYSFKTAYDLRNMIMNNQKIMKELLAVQLRIEALESIIKDDSMEISQKMAGLQTAVSERFEMYIKNNRMSYDEIIEQIKKRYDIVREDIKYVNGTRKEKIKNELADIHFKIMLSQEKRRMSLSDSIQSLLRRNPTAVSKKYSGAVEELRYHISQKGILQRIYNRIIQRGE